ncbi:MAG: SAM-dependent methyltransferase [Pseudomonadota bacterium]
MDIEAEAEKTPLEDRLIELIGRKGPITIADYMADALGHPHDGYYMTQQPIGETGDFTTAPEVSQIFGELIGLWLVDVWRNIGSPENFNLVELGPGRGVLMEDILRATRVRPAFAKAAQVCLVETSGRLRLEQQKRLKGSGVKPIWADDLADIPPGPALVVANEFFDCLPIQQFERVEKGWRERLVGVNANASALAFTLSAAPAPENIDLPAETQSKPGDIVEISPAAQTFTSDLAAMIADQSGAALIIDYGHAAAGFGETLQAVRKHKFWPPLASPGRADLTAHVDFAALTEAAVDAGAAVYGPTAQGRFLERLGLALRLEMLCKDKSLEAQHDLRAGAERIAAPDQMGELFKALCITGPDQPEPPGFFDI